MKWYFLGGVVLGLLCFYKGFFLTRVELANQSQCTSTTSAAQCNIPAQYSKCVVIIIDALRLDFVVPKELSHVHSEESAAFYLNRLLSLQNLLRQQPNHTFVSGFMADPPTTTLQRLKALTMGGLPTFIDIKDDVSSPQLQEDNIIFQLNKHKKKIVFMGDDTWLKLFPPNRFLRSFPFESFQVKDLDTLDRGVEAHLIPELTSMDYDVLVAHFLGVDHAGHSYGPRHPEMTRKLQEMDAILSKVIINLPPQSLLLVMGDHGMTESGNHGGSSLEEKTTVLFAHTTGEAPFRGPQEVEIQQVDLVATLALLLDVPIPFNNLGFFIPQLLRGTAAELKKAAQLNAKQIATYFRTYPEPVVDENILSALEQGKESAEGLRRLARMAMDQARQKWTIFHLPLMLLGSGLCLCSVLLLARNLPPLPRGLGLGLGLNLLALLSNSYIVVDPWVASFCLATTLLVDNRTWLLPGLGFLRIGLVLGSAVQASQAHEAHSFLHAGGSSLVLLFCSLPLLDSSRHASALWCFYGSGLVATMGYWLFNFNLLAKFVLLVWFPLACVGPDVVVDDMLQAGLVVLALLLGPNGNLLFLPWFFAVAPLVVSAYDHPLHQGLTLGLLVQLGFFVSGHQSGFEYLRITSPYVGFEEFNYYRGVVMLTLDTFVSHLVGLCWARRRKNGRQVVMGLLFVLACRTTVTCLFVLFARRHLMVWAIFAPKFVFEASGLLASLLFATVLEGLVARKQQQHE